MKLGSLYLYIRFGSGHSSWVDICLNIVRLDSIERHIVEIDTEDGKGPHTLQFKYRFKDMKRGDLDYLPIEHIVPFNASMIVEWYHALTDDVHKDWQLEAYETFKEMLDNSGIVNYEKE